MRGFGGGGFHTRLGARRGRGGCCLRVVLEYTCSAGWRDERFELGLQVVAEFSQLCVVLWDADEDVPGYFHHFSSATFFVKRRTHFVPSRAAFNLRRTVKGEIICDHHTSIKKQHHSGKFRVQCLRSSATQRPFCATPYCAGMGAQQQQAPRSEGGRHHGHVTRYTSRVCCARGSSFLRPCVSSVAQCFLLPLPPANGYLLHAQRYCLAHPST